jgi:hypothetical protein
MGRGQGDKWIGIPRIFEVSRTLFRINLPVNNFLRRLARLSRSATAKSESNCQVGSVALFI